jgi:hypothetical protein
MNAVTIHDMQERGGFRWLAVDLIHVLKVFEPEVLASSWRCRRFWCIPKFGDEACDDSAAGKQMTGPELLQWASGWQQVIDGEFIGTRECESSPWLVIVAEDSTYYVVVSRESSFLNRVREHFRDVRPCPEWAEHYA